MSSYSFLGLFSGAGGLDLGFENAGFHHILSNDILKCAVDTIKFNRPSWDVVHEDVKNFHPNKKLKPDILLAGFPCQGFSLGGHRKSTDQRNELYREVIRIADSLKPRVIVMENVLNLRTMIHPLSSQPFEKQIKDELQSIGYQVRSDYLKVANYGVPQTRRRFILIAFREEAFGVFGFPKQSSLMPAEPFLKDFINTNQPDLPNHSPEWGFNSRVHIQTNNPINDSDPIIPVRLSRTASDGNPIRNLKNPFPAIDTGTIWGWAQGNVECKRVQRKASDHKYQRSLGSQVKLWRLTASRIRSFTPREYARLQTFPDTWQFQGSSKRDLQIQIGNAVPVNFAESIARQIMQTLEFIDGKTKSLVVPIKERQIPLAM